MAQAPNPTRVMAMPVLPSGRVGSRSAPDAEEGMGMVDSPAEQLEGQRLARARPAGNRRGARDTSMAC